MSTIDGQRDGTPEELEAARFRFGHVRALTIVPEDAIRCGDWRWVDGCDLHATEAAIERLVRRYQ